MQGNIRRMRVCPSFFSSVCLVLLLPCPVASVVQAQEVAARVAQLMVYATEGTVKSGESTTTAAKTAPVMTEAGGTLSTGADASTSLALGSLGAARMQKETEVKVPAETEAGHSLELLKGKLFMNIDAAELKKDGPQEFKLKTPTALLAVKGTRFFATAKDDQERVGVHEGKVVVQDAAGQATVELTDGMVVDITAGKPGSARAMTSDEKAESTEYDLASLTRQPAPAGARWEPMVARQKSGGQKGEMLPDGNIRFTWPLVAVKSLLYQETYFHYDLKEEQARDVVALELRFRVIGADTVSLRTVSLRTDGPKAAQETRITPTKPGWQTVMLPFPGHNTKRPTGFNQRVHLYLFPALRAAGDSMKKVGVLEIAPVRLLQVPH